MLRVERDGKKYSCRILEKGTRDYNVIAKHYGCRDDVFLDFHELFWLKASRRYFIGRYQPIFQDKRWFGFSSIQEAKEWLKTNDFKILRHYPKVK